MNTKYWQKYTTISIKKETRDYLEVLKHTHKFKKYDDVIDYLLKINKECPEEVKT